MSMKKLYLKDHKQIFRYFAHAPYAKDVIIQQSNETSGNMMKDRTYHTAIQTIHDYKEEKSVLPNRIRTSMSSHVKGIHLIQRFFGNVIKNTKSPA